MQKQASVPLRIIYCLAVFGAVSPFPISGWVMMTTGGNATVPILGPILLLILGIYRIISVARNGSLLISQESTSILRALRVMGIIGMVLGATVAVAWPFMGQIALGIFGKPGDAGIAYYVVGVYFAMAKGFAPLGVIMFEASRLIGFEAHNSASTSNHSL